MLCYKDEEADLEESHRRGKPFSFTKCQIPIGSKIEYINDKTIKAIVIDDRKIKYDGEIMYMTTIIKNSLNAHALRLNTV